MAFSTKAVLFVATLLLAAQTQADKRPCGRKVANCPGTQVCVPNDPECTNMNRCMGTCDYPTCGGFRVEPKYCDEDSICVDDARDEGGCGQACDRPGICVPKDQPTCTGDEETGCPDGMGCFAWSTEYPVVGLGDDSVAICLIS